MSEPVKGSCLCGAVKFSAPLKNEHVDACHCSQCRQWGGGPFMNVMAAQAPVFEDDSQLGIYESSDWAERLFCKNCGSSLMWRMKSNPDMVAIAAFAVPLSDQADFRLQVFTDSKPGFYAFANDTREMTGAELMAAFESGESVS
jgi:hypothetical protein